MSIQITVQWNSVNVADAAVAVVDRARLLQQADACVPVGTAPDGLPLVLSVRRSASIVEPVLHALHAANARALSTHVRDAMLALDGHVQRERRALGISPRGPHHDRPRYLTRSTVPNLVGDTLLARLLDPASPLLLPEDRWSHGARSDAVDVKTSAGVLMPVAERLRVQHALASKQRLALPLYDAPALVVRTGQGDAEVEADDQRPFVFEDLRSLRSTTFYTYQRVDGDDQVQRFQGPIGDTAAYRRALRDASAVGWTVTRKDLLSVVAEVARSLAPLHDAGLVHGDVKPANVLVTGDGGVAHDSLDVKVGTISAAGTKGWNAPEQIIARPVTPATDVFALAQLVVQILEAAVFGDERSFIVPIGGGRRIRERMLAAPDVYLDPSLVPFDDAGVAAWRAFLRRCLALDADQRVQSVHSFADMLMELAERHPVRGRRVVTGLAGRLTRSVDRESMYWLLQDAAGW